jgi:hypothetical protein
MNLAGGMLMEFDQEAKTTRRVLEMSGPFTQDEAKSSAHIMSMSRIAVVRTILLNHWYHHRGQLSVYLRDLDVPVPSIYGPSADENPFG